MAKTPQNPISIISRMQFLKLTGMGTLGLFAAPSLLLGGCSGDDEEDDVKPAGPSDPAKVGSVAIIGAGAAGLQAAQDLISKNIAVTIYEASNTWGGRVRSLHSWANFPVELGAEEVHGVNSLLGTYVKRAGGNYSVVDTTDYVFLPPLLLNESKAEQDVRFAQAKQLYEQLEELDSYDGADLSLLDYIRSKGIDDATIPWLNSVLANEAGTSLRRIGMKSRYLADENWQDPGADSAIANLSMQQVLENEFSSVLSRITGSTAIIKIDVTGENTVVLTDNKGQTHNHRRVIVTAPLAVLKANKIDFQPGLPQPHRNAIAQLGMDAGMKVILRFKKKFWDDNTGSIYGAGPVPEYWATAVGRNNDDRYLTAFVMGEAAEQLANSGESAGVQNILKDLDNMYGPGKATDNLDDHLWIDWKKEEWIGGAYSFPAIGSAGVAAAFESPVRESIFFAGEHTHTTGYYGTVHGALETGKRAARQVLDTGR